MSPSPLPTVTRLALALVPAFLALGAAAGQAAAPGPGGDPAAMPAPATSPGELVCRGAGYSARFDARGLHFSADVPSELPLGLEFELLGARLGDQPLPCDTRVEPVGVGARVAFDRGACIEWYEALGAGLEQSFEFKLLPRAAGDLVVTGRLRSALPGVAHGGGLYFGPPAGPGISVGAVTGIDALGRTVAGSMALQGELLELRLPAEFIAAAALPLILDPLIGPSTEGPDTNQLGSPDVAYDEGADEYLLVYEKSTAFNNRDILGQRVNGSGQLLGPEIAISNSTTPLLRGSPRVVNVDAENQFVVAWEQVLPGGGSELAVRLVAVGSGSLSPVQVVQRPPGDVDVDMDLGGSSTNFIGFGNCSAVIVFQRIQNGLATVRFARIHVQSGFGAALTIEPSAFLEAPSTELLYTTPTITKSRDQNDHYCVVYQVRSIATPNGPNQLRARLLGADGDLEPVLTLPQVALDMTRPQVDGGRPLSGGSSRWVVAFEQRQSPASVTAAIGAMELSPTGSALSPTLVASGATQLTSYLDSHHNPTVAFTGQKFHLAAMGRIQLVAPNGLEFSARLFERDAQPGPWVQYVGPQETSIVPSVPSIYVPNLALVSQWSADSEPSADKDGGLLIWVGKADPGGPALDPKLEFSLFQSSQEKGTAEVLGGGCTGGGTPLLSGPPTLGTQNYKLELAGVNQFVSAVLLNLDFTGGATFTCGSCTSLLPDLTLLAIPANTRASLLLNLPSNLALVGTQLHLNWFSIGYPSTLCPLYTNVVSSPILRLTLGQ